MHESPHGHPLRQTLQHEPVERDGAKVSGASIVLRAGDLLFVFDRFSFAGGGGASVSGSEASTTASIARRSGCS
jgi:hypothetical protein